MTETENAKLVAEAREAAADFLDYEPGEYEVIIENGWKVGAARLTHLAAALETYYDARDRRKHTRPTITNLYRANPEPTDSTKEGASD